MSGIFEPLLMTVSEFRGPFTAVTGFILALAAQLTFRETYNFPEDFLTRTTHRWQPNTRLSVPDNACEREKYQSKMTFDFIIVGSGPAGSVIANRLSENPKHNILLIEAGLDPIVESAVPIFFPLMLNNSRSWVYTADVVDTSSQAFKKGTNLSSGKMLGGSSGMNAILYICGNDRDYDSWAQQGNVGWDYKSFLHYIKKSEDNTNQEVLGDGSLHGRGGFLTVSDYEITDPFVQVIRKAFSEIGYKQIKNYRKGNYIGSVELQGTIRGNERCSASRAFLNPIKNRKNLYVMKQSLVTKVLFSGSKAIGVNVRTTKSSCRDIKIYSSKEVILSAGALQSPKILLQSGVGKFEDLSQFKIPQVKNLPVGKNLQDHVESVNFMKINSITFPKSNMFNDLQKYFFQRSGILSNLGTTNHNGFVNTKSFHAKYPDIQYLFTHFPKAEPFFATILANAGFKDEFIDGLVQINQNFEVLMTYTILLNPKSRGSVKLKSRDPTAPPKITSGYLTHLDDVDTLVRGINKLQTLINTQAMQANFVENIKFNIPECNSIPYPSDCYWRCYLKYFTASLWHPSGSCKMGNSSDQTAVVDHQLRVYGIKNLRVADASIMPNIPSGNTQCPVYAIGEKAADMIKETWR